MDLNSEVVGVRFLFNAIRLNTRSHIYSCPDLRRPACIDIGESLLRLSKATRSTDDDWGEPWDDSSITTSHEEELNQVVFDFVL